MKKFLLFLTLLLVIPVAMAEYKPLSDAPINSADEFNNDEEMQSPEFTYPDSSVSELRTVEQQKNEVPTTVDYAAIYNSLQKADFSYLHNIDPDQYYDMKDATWAPYPLLRLNSAIYFKDEVIEPGYYLINPREHKGKWYILFKQNGQVCHIIPTYNREITPMDFYETHIPKPKLKKSAKLHMKFLEVVGKTKSSKRKTETKCYMEINDLNNYFLSIVIYYGTHKYSTIFRSIQL